MMIVKIIVALLLFLVLCVVALRIRKLGLDKRRISSPPLDPRLVSPPESPYQRAAGFRILADEDSTVRREPERPRLDHDKEYVFSDAQLGPVEEYVGADLRHDEKWALARSAHRGRTSPSLSSGGITLLVTMLVLGVVVLAASQHWY